MHQARTFSWPIAIVLSLALCGASWAEPSGACWVGAAPDALEARYSLTGRVVNVSDGDSFTLLSEGRKEKVRLASIDAPEIGRGRERPGQDMSRVSRESLAKLLQGRNLTVQCFEQDHYGRNICDVPLDEGGTANRRQVEAGLAWANMQGRGKYMRDAQMCRLEAQARRERLGLWQFLRPVRPWAWRYDCWKQGRC